MHYKTIVISDVHLGTAGAKARELVKFLSENTCDHLILNGDIIDAWELKKYGSWQTRHTRFFKAVLKMMEELNTQVLYLHGNHDDFLDAIIPLKIGNFSIQMDYIYESFGKRYYIVHGDIFDTVNTRMKWMAKLGSIGYTFLLWLNTLFNIYRKKMGLPYYSFSQYIKTKVKSMVSRATDYEKKLIKLAKDKECVGIICGHTHKPAMRDLGDVVYMNSGDWVESLSALTEDYEGNWNLYQYTSEYQLEIDSYKFPPSEEEKVIDSIQEYFAKAVMIKSIEPKDK